MSTQEVGILSVKPDEQGAELIDPGETGFVGEASLVDFSVEQAFASTLGSLAITFVLGNVGDDPIIETDLASLTGIEGAVSVKERTLNVQAQAFHAFECGLEMGFEVESVVVIACHHARRSGQVPVGIHNR